LLGFFPGMASDSQIAQSQAYWRSATPIAVVDAGGEFYTDVGGQLTCPHIVIRNTGAYQITLSKILGGNASITQYRDYSAGGINRNLTTLKMAPGEEICFSGYLCETRCQNHDIWIGTATSYTSHPVVLAGASSICNNGSTGQTLIKNFGFEYIAMIEGQQITKKQIGAKDLIIRCG